MPACPTESVPTGASRPLRLARLLRLDHLFCGVFGRLICGSWIACHFSWGPKGQAQSDVSRPRLYSPRTPTDRLPCPTCHCSPLTIRIPPSIQASRQPPLLSARQSDSADKLPASPLQLVIVSRPHPSPRRAAALKRQRGAVLVPGSVARAWRAQGFGAVRVENGAKGLAIRAF